MISKPFRIKQTLPRPLKPSELSENLKIRVISTQIFRLSVGNRVAPQKIHHCRRLKQPVFGRLSGYGFAAELWQTRLPTASHLFSVILFITTVSIRAHCNPRQNYLAFIIIWIFNLIWGDSGNSEGDVGLGVFFLMSIGIEIMPKYGLEVDLWQLWDVKTDLFETNYLISLQQPPLNLRRGVYLKHQNLRLWCWTH